MTTRWLLRFVLVLALVASAQVVAAQDLPAGAAQINTIRKITGDVYEFVFTLTTGPGAYDRIGVHRVVRVEDGKPIVSHNAVLLTHGRNWGFEAAFLGDAASPHSFGVYLASHGIDVWGIDFSWTLVPQTVSDFTFMQNWGMQHDIDDLERALRFARKVRSQTGSDRGRLTLLSWSRGGWIGYGLLNQESQWPCRHRQVKAFIPVDTFYKANAPFAVSGECSFEATVNKEIKAGIYVDATGQLFQQLGALAVRDPSGLSPVLPGLTNLQASLTLGAALFQFLPEFTSFFHFVGGTFGSSGISGLAFTSISRWNNLLTAATPFEPVRLLADYAAVTCGDVSLPFDKHLEDITVPVFYVGAGGGFGSAGLYTLSLLGSEDVTHDIVSFYPPAEAVLDFGHVDLFTADDAPNLVWSNILLWLTDHEGENSCPA